MPVDAIIKSLVTVAIVINAAVGGVFIGQTNSQLDFYPNIETVGVALSGGGLPPTANMLYRRSGEANWRSGHPLVRIEDGRLIGSLFGLMPATSYEVKVLVGSTEISGTTTTQQDELQFTPSSVLHVNDDAPAGGDGSAAAPFRTIQEALNRATPGTQVLVADGIYPEAITFPASGTANQWIQVKAEGSGAILEGSNTLTGKIWTPHPTKSKVWYTTIGSAIGYLARDRQRFYSYDTLSDLLQSRGHGGVFINEGWFYDSTTRRLYVRNASDPSAYSWQVPVFKHAFDVNARDWIWIEGFEMRFYNRCGVCTVNASHLVIRNNKIRNMQLGIFFDWNGTEQQGNDTRVEYNEIYDPNVNEFPWLATKGSSMEGTGIVVRGHIGAIVRGNDIHNYFNGIYTGSSAPEALNNPAVAFDADIYNNHIHAISDDALEPEGPCVNHRFRNNMIDSTFVGVSLAPITIGPTWVLRSVISNYTSKSIKWAVNPDGVIFIYHNTSWTNAANVFGMDLITPVHNTVMRNNIFQSTSYAIHEVPTGSAGNDWNNDNWHTTLGTSAPHFKWENIDYSNIAKLCTATGLECNGYEDIPGFSNPAAGDFTLAASSPNIDRGEIIHGINDDFKGSAPDVGAYEVAFDPPPLVSTIVRADSNPTNAVDVRFTVTFTEPVTGVNLVPLFNDFVLVPGTGITGAEITSVSPVSGSIYTVGVNTGTGNGTIRLDISDNDSILDAKSQPLGGVGLGNGNYTTGEAYTINKSIANAKSISFKSAGAYDGWILESGEDTNNGGTLDRSATTLSLGDDQKDKQYRAILSFDTSALPDRAVILSAQLKVKRQGIVGTDPFGTHGALLMEIRNGSFNNNLALQTADFSAAASPDTARDPFAALTSSWYAAQLSNVNLGLINKAGVTQFRLFFSKDDNDNLASDVIKFFSGSSVIANRPELVITYYLP